MVEVNKLQLLISAVARPLRSSGGRLNNQSGQAVVEYILVLVVTIGILLGVMYQFNEAFKKYVQSYFGEYVACLLETGELPALGGGDGTSAEMCSASFEPFSLKNGRPFISSDSSGSGGRSGAGSGRRSGSARPRSATVPANKVTRNMRTRNAETNGSSSSGDGSDDSKKNITKRYVSAPSYNFRANRQRADGQIQISSSFKMAGQKKDEKPYVANITSKAARGGASVGPAKLLVSLDKFKPKQRLIDLKLDLSVGDYVRYIIIFFIIVMIVIFFGGQLFQIKKGYEAS
ncbi:MAG: hypothetical protein IT287_07230 [Bdellovibrionaceae bacterium]|nr:hypothetical protein [Pseudobdellovibrionaceae bacterium]